MPPIRHSHPHDHLGPYPISHPISHPTAPPANNRNKPAPWHTSASFGETVYRKGIKLPRELSCSLCADPTAPHRYRDCIVLECHSTERLICANSADAGVLTRWKSYKSARIKDVRKFYLREVERQVEREAERRLERQHERHERDSKAQESSHLWTRDRKRNAKDYDSYTLNYDRREHDYRLESKRVKDEHPYSRSRSPVKASTEAKHVPSEPHFHPDRAKQLEISFEIPSKQGASRKTSTSGTQDAPWQAASGANAIQPVNLSARFRPIAAVSAPQDEPSTVQHVTDRDPGTPDSLPAADGLFKDIEALTREVKSLREENKKLKDESLKDKHEMTKLKLENSRLKGMNTRLEDMSAELDIIKGKVAEVMK